jgi:hypothetical protein
MNFSSFVQMVKATDLLGDGVYTIEDISNIFCKLISNKQGINDLEQFTAVLNELSKRKYLRTYEISPKTAMYALI